MATKVFSSRADERLLSFADALARKEYGVSYGQYCGTVLLRSIEASGHMPHLEPSKSDSKKKQAAAFIGSFSSLAQDPGIGRMSDSEIRNLIASRYE